VKITRARDLVMRIPMTEITRALARVMKIRTMNRPIAAPGATTAVQVRTKTITTIVMTAAAATITVAAATMIIAAVARMITAGVTITEATITAAAVKMTGAATAAMTLEVEEITAAPEGVAMTEAEAKSSEPKCAEAAKRSALFLSLVRC
jgi:hypothetical protein